MVKPLSEVGIWRAGGRGSAGDFNAVAEAAKAMRRSHAGAGLLDATGFHTRQQQHIGTAIWTARVSAYATTANGSQWTYTLVELVKSTAGYGGWTDHSNGYEYDAFNENEDQNPAIGGLMGNGVDTTNLVGTYWVQPIPVGTRVTVKDVPLADGTTEHWIIGMPSGVDGACP